MRPLFPFALACTLLAAAAVPPAAAMEHGRPLDLRAFAAPVTDALAPGAIVPNFRLTDHRGVTRELYYEAGAKAVVLVFTAPRSPRAAATAAALRALRARWSAADVVIWQIDSTAGSGRARLVAEQTLHNNDTPVLLDESQLVATELGATRQLEAFVLSAVPAPVLLYRGPLDNADPAGLAAATEHHVADAVAAHLAGRAPARASIPLSAAAPLLDLPPSPNLDYATGVAPVVLRRCISCHTAGGIAPHTYAKHEDLAARASSLRASMLLQRMTPWHADPQFGVFANNVALTPLERTLLHGWARAGAPRGTGPDPLATPRAAVPDWPLGPPDLVITLPEQAIKAQGPLPYEYVEVTVPTATDRWLRAAVVKPGNPRVVHHALVFEGNRLDLLFTALSTGQLPGLGGFFAGYVPGLDQTWFPDGSGKLLRAGSQVTFQMHYTATGQPETDRTQIGFYFHPAPPERQLQTKAAVNLSLSIPPRAREYERTATFTPSTTRDVMLYELNPHMHYRGKRFRIDATYPDGSAETLLNVPQYDFAWQSGYRLATPKRLPRGTVLRVTGAFDNSEQNPWNPNPAASVGFGEQTDDEMFIGYINYAELPDNAAVRAPVFAGNTAASARVGEPFRLALAAANAPAAYTAASALPAGLTLAAGVLSGTPTAPGRHLLVIEAANAAGTAATYVDLTVAPAAAAPVFTRQPVAVRGRIGGAVTLSAALAPSPTPVTYTWFVRGGEFCNTDAPTLTLTDLTAAHAGDWVLVARNAAGTAATVPAAVSLDFSGLVNLSTRAAVGTGANLVIPGITVRGTAPKTLLIRAAGPALSAFGVTGTLANPALAVFDAAGDRVFFNDNWSEVPDVPALAAATAAQGAFALPAGSRDAAMLVTLRPGSYTVQVSGVGTGTAAQGVALVEVYEADATPGTLVNLSCRARVGTGGDVLIAGFAVGGTASKRLLIRGVGPTLGALGVTGTLADPKLELIRQSDNAVLAANDNWDAALAPAFSSVGAFALNAGSRDAALIATVPPGAYTVQVSGVNATTGIALVEVYELP